MAKWKTERSSKWNKTFIKIASIISYHSKAKRNKVGAILVKNNRIISIGYNGTISGFNNNCEKNNITKKSVVHAEVNAISKCAMSEQSTFMSILYVTTSPCVDCAKLIIQSGIKKVYYKKKYRDNSGIKLIKKAKISCHEI